MKLDNFDLEKYQEYNIEHKSVMTLIDNDVASKQYLGDIFLLINNTLKRYEENNIDSIYIAYYNSNPIGFISINILNDNAFVSYALLKEYQHQHLGALLLQEFSDKLFEIYNFDDIYLDINQKNIASIKTSSLVGFKKISSTKYNLPKM